jgi:hypothetical protein
MPFNPLRVPDDTVVLAGREVPGIVVIKGLSAPRDWETRMSFGMMGYRLRLKGIKPSKFSLGVSLYTQEHWDAWNEFSEVVRRPPPPDRSQVQAITSIPSLYRFIRTQGPPLRIRHALLEEYRINRVVVEDVTQPMENDRGVWTLDIKLIQYQPPVRVLSTSGGRAEDEPRTAQERQIAALTTELNGLANEGNQ